MGGGGAKGDEREQGWRRGREGDEGEEKGDEGEEEGFKAEVRWSCEVVTEANKIFAGVLCFD